MSNHIEASKEGKEGQNITLKEYLLALKPTPFHIFSSPKLDVSYTQHIVEGRSLQQVANYNLYDRGQSGT
jgi:hypothetical protein